MKNTLRFLSVFAVLALGSFAFAGDDKKADCKDCAACCKEEKSECCKAEKKDGEKQPEKK